MATLTHAESRRLYSWWWEGHTSPKNSKWLQENLKDMDFKVKTMIKLLEEDADSFARRAEMYYKKRPELLKLVEEFYRTYRALAERYDHATSALRQAHRTMAEAFPHHIPFISSDESPHGSLVTEASLHTPEMSPMIHAMFESDDSQKDVLRVSSRSHGIRRNEVHSDKNDELMSKPGLKQLHEMFGKGQVEVEAHAKFSEGRIRKGLKFHDDEENSSDCKRLREEISQLSKENENLKSHITSESMRANKSEAEVQSLNSKNEDAALQYHVSLERISTLESNSKEDFKKLNNEMLLVLEKLKTGEERYLLLQKANESLLQELDRFNQKAQEQMEELRKKQEQLDKLNILLQEERQGIMQAKRACFSLEKIHAQSQEQKRLLALEIQAGTEKVKDIELRKATLEEDLQRMEEENGSLKEQNLSSAARIKNLQDDVQCLEQTISQLSSEKKSSALQYQLSLERIAILETEISHSKEGLKKLKGEMLMAAEKLNTGEERCLFLEKANESLQLELDILEKKAREQQEELGKKQEELDKLNLLLQKEHQGLVQAETARLSLEKLHFQSQEQERLLALEIELLTEKLKENELSRMVLEEELQQIKDKNGSLNEQHLIVASKIMNLQEEILFVKDSNMKLEDEVKILTEEKQTLQQELYSLKENRDSLEQSYHLLAEQVEAVNFNLKSLQALVKELQNENTELKDICSKHENDKVVHLDNLNRMEKISEQSVVLENSLSDANVEIESLREKIQALEQSCELLCEEISLHVFEKATLSSQVEAISHDMEKLSERNAFLENSLSAVNVELDGLKGKLKLSEESCQSLSAQKSSLLSERSSLVSQVQGTIQILVNREARCVELEDKHFNLEKEQDKTIHQVMELQDMLRREKEEYETLILSIVLSSNSQISALENQISLMQEERRLSEKEFEAQEVKYMDVEFDIFILQRSLCDMSEKHSILSMESQKLLEASKCADKSVSELKKELHIQEIKLTISEERNEKLREGIQLMLRVLCSNQDCESLDCIKDELLVHLCLQGIKDLLGSFSDLQEEKQHLLIEKSVVITILEQFGQNIMNLVTGKNALEQETKLKSEELLLHQSKQFQLLEMNEYLRQDMQASLHGVTNELNEEIILLTEKLAAVEVENLCLKETVVNLYKCGRRLMVLENDLNTTRTSFDKLNHEIETGSIHLAKKDIELLQANQRLLSKQEEIKELCRNLKALKVDTDGAMMMRKESEKKVFRLSEDYVQREIEISRLRQENDMLNWEVDRSNKDTEALRSREEYLTFQLQKEINEVKCCEVDIAALLKDSQITTINADLFGEKACELLITCESLEISALVQREKLYEEIAIRNASVVELNEKLGTMEGENRELKKELNSYLLLVADLWDDVSSLEEDIVSLAECYVLNHQRKQGNQLMSLHRNKINQGSGEYDTATMPAGISELQKLHHKVKALKKVVIDTGSNLKQESFESSSRSNTPLSEVLKEEEVSGQVEKQSKVIMQLEKDDELGIVGKLQKGDAGTSILKHEQMMKDIQLDHVLSPSQYGNDVCPCGYTMMDIAETSDQALDLCETTDRDDNNQMPKESRLNVVHEIEYHPIEAVEEEKHKYPSSELVIEKELSFDKQALPKQFRQSLQEWNGRITEMLSSDSQRLLVLQIRAQELKRNMEASGLGIYPTSFEFDTIKAELKEAEESISQLIDINVKLTKKAEVISASQVRLLQEENEAQSKNQRQVSELAQKGSEKIGKLELEMDKIRYIFLKLKEEQDCKSSSTSTDRRKVQLRDYFYGRMSSHRRKRGPCGCVRPKTMDD